MFPVAPAEAGKADVEPPTRLLPETPVVMGVFRLKTPAVDIKILLVRNNSLRYALSYKMD